MQKNMGPRPISLKSKPVLNLLDLHDDVLFLIISKCDVKTRGRLSRVCRFLCKLISEDCVWLSYSRQITIIKSASPVTSSTSRPKIKKSLKEQCRISLNWEKGIYQEKVILRHNPKQLPWMQYCENRLWVSTRHQIKCYRVKPDGLLQENPQLCLSVRDDDVSRFVIKSGRAVSGCRDGSIYIWDSDTGQRLWNFHKIHQTDAQAVDFFGHTIVSGSRDKSVKILSSSFEDNCNHIRASLSVDDRIWSLAVAPDGSTFTVGTAGCFGNSPLTVWDLQSATQLFPLGSFRRGAGILDVKYESPHTLLTCGYDTFLRLWDTRVGECVREWEEPYDTALYCIQSDSNVSMVTGTARHGMTRLWDKRQNQPVQVYYIGLRNSPVYSMVFDSSHIYAALDLSVNMVDFSVY